MKLHRELLEIHAPVEGVVQQLGIHTVGGVVTAAQTLMEVVPDDVLEAEVHISNRDIGFVNAGQLASVKIAAFPYTRYGYLSGRVSQVSNDSIQDKGGGLVFVARTRVSDNHFKIGAKSLILSPGMEVTAEIKTGKQKVWEYF
jgi:hemolysin D